MKSPKIINKKILVASLFASFLALASLWVHNVYAAQSSISLNSPVSFPIDI